MSAVDLMQRVLFSGTPSFSIDRRLDIGLPNLAFIVDSRSSAFPLALPGYAIAVLHRIHLNEQIACAPLMRRISLRKKTEPMTPGFLYKRMVRLAPTV